MVPHRFVVGPRQERLELPVLEHPVEGVELGAGLANQARRLLAAFLLHQETCSFSNAL